MSVRKIRIPQSSSGIDEPIAGLESVIDHENMQRLRGIKQLDTVKLVYPGAVGDRFVHSLGTLHHQRRINKTIVEHGLYDLDETEKVTLEVGSILHDVGIPPESHGTEFVLMTFGQPSHDVKALEFLEEMESEIKQVKGVNFSLLKQIFERKNPLYKTIWGSLGSNELDYVNRDARECGLSISSDTQRIEDNLVFDGEKYGIGLRFIEDAKKHNTDKKFMYFTVYNWKQCALWKGVLRSAIFETVKEGKIEPEDIWKMTDAELYHAMINAGDLAQKSYKRIRNRIEAKTFLTVKIIGKEHYEITDGKPIHVRGLSEDELMKIAQYFGNIERVMKFERSLEVQLGLERGDITVAEMPHLRMIQPEDIPLHIGSSRWTTLYTEDPFYRTSLESEIRSNYALRIGVIRDKRKEVYDMESETSLVFNALTSLI